MATKETEISVAEAFISQHFKPATTVADADFTLTTKQVFERIEKIMPGACSGTDIYSTLLRLGFKLHDTSGEMEMEWLIKRAENK